MSNEKIPMRDYLVESGVLVSFELTQDEYVHYKFERGLITIKEAMEMLGKPLDPCTSRRMAKLARQLSLY